MSELPPRARLAHVVRSLAKSLPGQTGTMLDAPRFAEGRDALARLASTAERAAQAMTELEAAHLAELLLARWSDIGEPVLEPVAAIVAPEEIWVGERARRVELALATSGVDDDWEVVWEGINIEAAPARTAVLVAKPPEGDAAASAHVRARVRARATGGARVLLVAEAAVRLRRPIVIASDDARRVVVRDHTGEPAVGVAIEIGEQRATSGAGGLVELAAPIEPDAQVRVHGVAAGRIRAR